MNCTCCNPILPIPFKPLLDCPCPTESVCKQNKCNCKDNILTECGYNILTECEK